MRVTYQQRLKQYEKIKQTIANLPPDQYEKLVIKLARKLRI